MKNVLWKFTKQNHCKIIWIHVGGNETTCFEDFKWFNSFPLIKTVVLGVTWQKLKQLTSQLKWLESIWTERKSGVEINQEGQLAHTGKDIHV